MHWKSWPYWVRGAAILGTLHVIVYIVVAGIYAEIWMVFADFPAFVLLDTNWAVKIFYGNNPAARAGAGPIIAGTVQWILIGALFGYLYGKFKNRKQLNSGSLSRRETGMTSPHS